MFCASLADVFEDRRPEPRLRLWQLIRDTPHLDWLLLTKRPEYSRPCPARLVFLNVWLGVSVEDQARDERIPVRTPAAVRLLEREPLLWPLEFSDVSRRSRLEEQPAGAGAP